MQDPNTLGQIQETLVRTDLCLNRVYERFARICRIHQCLRILDSLSLLGTNKILYSYLVRTTSLLFSKAVKHDLFLHVAHSLTQVFLTQVSTGANKYDNMFAMTS